ncbi:RidA family protein [Niveispirillum sp. KHB5.9]|uniref:RidA family protein n=1 Tax=Niveispirillum sp. KHB5.9 TaxID=3400269 RepID=UPI003A8A3203
MIEKLNPATLAPPVMGLYAQIAIAPAGRLAFIAGQVALDADGNLVGAGSHEAQARQCFANIAAALAALGTGPERIVKMTINVAGHHPGLIAPLFGAGRDVFGDAWPVTASMLLGVQTLGLPEWLVEVDAVVSLPD